MSAPAAGMMPMKVPMKPHMMDTGRDFFRSSLAGSTRVTFWVMWFCATPVLRFMNTCAMANRPIINGTV